MKWNLRLAAASRGIWKASELQKMLAGRGLVISAGKMSGLWSGNPNAVKLADLDVICAVLGCEIGELLVPEPVPDARPRTAGRAGRRRGSRRRAQAPRRPVPAPAVSAGTAGSCPSCDSWGALYSGVCRGCYDFARRHGPGPCEACRRRRPLKEGYCRNCWLQAALQAAGTARRAPDLGPADFAAVRLAPAVVRRRGQDDPPAAAAPAGRGPRPRRAARSPLGAAGAAGPGPVTALPCPALDRRVGQQSRPRPGQGHRLPARRGPRLESPHPGRGPPCAGRHARLPRPRREDPLVRPRAGTAAPRPERLPHRRDPRSRRAARRRPRPSPGHVDREQARHAGTGHRRLRPQLGRRPAARHVPVPAPQPGHRPHLPPQRAPAPGTVVRTLRSPARGHRRRRRRGDRRAARPPAAQDPHRASVPDDGTARRTA